MIELIAGTCPNDPPIRVLAMPAATMLFAIGFQLLALDILRIRGVPAPCRISSLPKGAPLRPGIYAYIEDICAVDGSGGTEFRQRLNLRYQASKAFREMLHRLTLFWAIGAIVCATVTTAIIFTIQRDAAYVVSFTTSLQHQRLLIQRRLAGFFHSSGPVSGPPSPFPGSSATSRRSTTTGPKRSGRPSFIVDFICISTLYCTVGPHGDGAGVWFSRLDGIFYTIPRLLRLSFNACHHPFQHHSVLPKCTTPSIHRCYVNVVTVAVARSR